MEENKYSVPINTESDFVEGETIAQASEEFHAEDFKYEAFISYRHVEPDAAIAEAIHKMVETFKVPKEFYVDGKRPVFRVFRDREELTTTSLSDSITEALRSSKFLIVICSKRTPLSEWCIKEAELFKEIRGEQYIIPVLVEGEPHESFPPPILGIKRLVEQADGALVEEEHEILAAELRPPEVQDPAFVGYEALEKSGDPKLQTLKKQALEQLKVEKYRIMAAILGCTFGDLKQRDKERRTRTLLKLSGVVATALLFFGVFMFNAYRNENIARVEATQSNSAMLLNTSRRLLDGGDRILAAMVSNRAMQAITQDMARYDELKAQHTGILNDTVFYSDAVSQTVIPTDNAYTAMSIHPSGEVLVAGYGTQDIGVWSAKNGARLLHFDGGSKEQYTDTVIDRTGTYLAAGGFDDVLRIWNWSDIEASLSSAHGEKTEISPAREIELGSNILNIEMSKDGRYTYVVIDGYLINTLLTFDTVSGDPVGQPIEVKAVTSDYLNSVAYDTVQNRILTVHIRDADDDSLIMYDGVTGQKQMSFAEPVQELEDSVNGETSSRKQNYEYAAFTKDGKYIIAAADKQYYVLDAATGKIVKDLNSKSYGGSQERSRMAETKDEKFFYVNSGYYIEKYDRKTWQLVAQISLGENETVRDFALSEQGTIIAISTAGRVSMAMNDVIVSGNIDYGEGRATGLLFTEDGSRVITISREDRNIKILTLADQENRAIVEGQLFTTTQDKKHTMLVNDGAVSIHDNTTGDIRPVAGDVLSFPTGYIGLQLKRQSSLSNDLSMLLTRNYKDDDNDGIGEKEVLVNIDLATGEPLWEQTEGFVNTVYAFTPDNAEVLQVSHNGEATRLEAKSGKVTETGSIKPGFITGILFAEDQSAFGIIYQEGSSVVYGYPDMQELQTIPGNLASLYREGSALTSVSVHNNTGYRWTEGSEEMQTVALAKERGENGTTDVDYNDYDRESGYLLSIMEKRNSDKTSNAYLIDFNSGNLVQSFLIDITDYDFESGTSVSGVILPGGRELLIDDNYFITRLNPDEEDFMLQEYETGSTAAVIQLLDYAALREKANDVIGDRALTAEELQEIGIESKEK